MLLSPLRAGNVFVHLVLVDSRKSKVGDPEIDDRAYELRVLLEGERLTPLFKV